MRDSKAASPTGGLRKSLAKSSERKSRGGQASVSAGSRAAKPMKGKILHNCLMEENYL
jgi:hypothetical protein